MVLRFRLCCLLMVVPWTGPALAQMDWDRFPQNPVLDVGPPGSWDDARVTPGTVIFDGGEYRLWYTGWDGTPDRNFQVGLATSSDGIAWNRCAANPIVSVGGPGAWDASSAANPAVLKEGGGYAMWYSGSDGVSRSIGYATSTDGISWNEYPANPVMRAGDEGAWDSWGAHWCSVVAHDGAYEMWYSGGRSLFEHEIGYATSLDGIAWTKYTGNPIISPGPEGSWNDRTIWFPSVVRGASIYHMWFAGYDGSRNRIGYAFSLDGVAWTLHPAPVLDIGEPGEWDDESVGSPCVVAEDALYKMWYLGSGNAAGGRVGGATSTGNAAVPSASSPGAGAPAGEIRTSNPARVGAHLTLEIPALGEDHPVVAQVYDASGRLMRTWRSEGPSADRWRISWDGTNQSGTAVGSGTYFWRFRWGATTRTRTVVLVR